MKLQNLLRFPKSTAYALICLNESQLSQQAQEIEIDEITIDLDECQQDQKSYLWIARRGWYGDQNQRLAEALRLDQVKAIFISQPSLLPEITTILAQHIKAQSQQSQRSQSSLKTPNIPPIFYCEQEDPLLADLSCHFYQNPTAKLKVFGVTGTNGKTSTTHFLRRALEALGERVALMGTVHYAFENQVLYASNTTPDALVIQRFAKEALELGATALVLEVSSHALSLGRTERVAFDAVGFCNLGRDHLDFHQSLEEYRFAKGLLADHCILYSLTQGKTPLVAAHYDEEGIRFMQRKPAEVSGIFIDLQATSGSMNKPENTNKSMQGFEHTNAQGFEHTNAQGFKHTNAQGFKHTNAQGFEHTNAQGFEHTNAQGFEHTNAQGFEHTNAQGFEHTNAQGIASKLSIMQIWASPPSLAGFQLTLKLAEDESITLSFSLIGDYHQENLALALAMLSCDCLRSAQAQGKYRFFEQIGQYLSNDQGVKGRMERVVHLKTTEGKLKIGLVDYAHTADALEKALKALRSLHQDQQFVVFGCGGNRDKGKRPLMLKVALEHADHVFLTADNPRYENMLEIIQDSMAYLDQCNALAKEQALQKITVLPDRVKAIDQAWRQLSAGALLVAGKGHEDYQEINGIKYEMSDQYLLQGSQHAIKNHQTLEFKLIEKVQLIQRLPRLVKS